MEALLIGCEKDCLKRSFSVWDRSPDSSSPLGTKTEAGSCELLNKSLYFLLLQSVALLSSPQRLFCCVQEQKPVTCIYLAAL